MTAASADRALMSLAQQVTADVVACSVMLAQVHGYERYEHGKLEHVEPYDRQGRRRVWVSGLNHVLFRYDAHGNMEFRQPYPGARWATVQDADMGTDVHGRRMPLREFLQTAAVEITGHTPIIPTPTGPVADPKVKVEPGMLTTEPEVKAYLRAHLTPGELDVLNKAGVTWHIEPMSRMAAHHGPGVRGEYMPNDRTVHLAGDMTLSNDMVAQMRKEGVSEAEIFNSRISGPPYGDTWQHLLLHETGHALDHAMGWPSDRSAQFWKFAPEAFPQIAHGASNPQEAFAELFAALRLGQWSAAYAGYPRPIPAQIQRAERKFLERVEREGLAASAAQEPLCIARYINGKLWFGPPGSQPSTEPSPIREA